LEGCLGVISAVGVASLLAMHFEPKESRFEFLVVWIPEVSFLWH
jgi:hypothetical protein